MGAGLLGSRATPWLVNLSSAALAVRAVGFEACAAVVVGLWLGLDALFAVWFAAAVFSGGWVIWRAHAVGHGVRGRLPRAGGTAPPAGFRCFDFSTHRSSAPPAALLPSSRLPMGLVLGSVAVAFYAIVLQISEALAKPTKPLGAVVLPALSATEHDAAEGPGALVTRAIVAVGLAMGAIMAVMLLAGEPMLVAVFGTQALAAGEQLFLAVAGIVLVGFVLEAALVSVGRAETSFVLSVLAAPMCALMLERLVPSKGLIAAGVALLGCATLPFLDRLLAVYFVLRGRLPVEQPETA